MNRLRQMLKGLGPQEPPKPQYYRVACPEGHWLQGQRTDGYQALRCPTCGGGIFVLPRSPLPEPPASSTMARPARTRAAIPAYADEGPMALSDPPAQSEMDGGAEIDWEEGPAEVPALPMAEVEIPEPEPEPEAKPEREPRPQPVRPRPRPAAASKAARAAAAEESEESGWPAVAVAERGSLWEGLKRRRHMILALAVATLVVSALGWNVRRQRLLELPKVVEIGRTRGLEALDAGEFDEAKLLLNRADRAARVLGGQIASADAIHQGALEAEIYADLVPERLEAILDEARAAPVDAWTATFRAKYRGRAVVLDVRVTAEPAAGAGHEIDYRVLAPGAEPVVGRFDLAGFRFFERSKLKVGERAVFGAKLESLERETGPRKGWRFTLQPESGVNLTHDSALEALGMSTSDVREGEGGH